MCGIYGIVGSPSVPLLNAMGKALSHRGPDEEGRYEAEGVALGIRRLSIVDPSGGQQPVSNEDGTVQVVFNGEIYNYPALRTSLEAKGHRFRSQTDTEVIAHAYEEYGQDCCRLFEGMFAFALWDQPRRQLLIARDRVGEKPLFYYHAEKTFLFASEIKAILQAPDFSRTLNATALINYLSRLYVPGEETIFENIKRLEPGHSLTFRAGRCQVSRYWDLRFTPKQRKDENASEAELRELLSESVRLRLAPEGPTGVFLSGGLDSSAILALGVRSGGDMRAYSMGFEARGSEITDERAFASQLADHFGVRYAEIEVTGREVRDVLPKIIWHFDEPFSGAVPQYFISKRASADTKVVLSGLGGDELFGNYGRRFRLQRALGYWGRPWDYLPRFLRPEHAVSATYAEWFGAFNSEARRQLLLPEVLQQVDGKKTVASLLQGYLAESDAHTLGDQVFLMDFKTQLVSEYLNYSDVLSMAWGLECRAPFLSTPLVELAARLSSRLRNRSGQEKYLLRKAVESALPPWVLQRKKAGFSLPYAAWLRAELKTMALDYLSPERLARGRYFRPAYVEQLLTSFYRDHRSDLAYPIWALLCFEVWREVVFQGHSPAVAAAAGAARS